ncbi:MAG: hypothetical protein NC093_07305 [Alistipes sp.]|nr:hypothetical protein [Alistipes sp.]
MDYEEVIKSFSKAKKIKAVYFTFALVPIAFVVFAWVFENLYLMIGFAISLVILGFIKDIVGKTKIEFINTSERFYGVSETNFERMFLQVEEKYEAYVAKRQLEIQVRNLYHKYKKLATQKGKS